MTSAHAGRIMSVVLLSTGMAASPHAVAAPSPTWNDATGRLVYADGVTVAFDRATGELRRSGGTRVSCDDDALRDTIWKAKRSGASPDQHLLELGEGVALVPAAAFEEAGHWYWGYALAFSQRTPIGQGDGVYTVHTAHVPLTGPCLARWRDPAPPPASPKTSGFTISRTPVGFAVWQNQSGQWLSAPGASSVDAERCAGGSWFCNGYIYDGTRWRWDGLSVSGSVPREEAESTGAVR